MFLEGSLRQMKTFNMKSTAEHRVWINPLHCVTRQGNYAEKVQPCALIDMKYHNGVTESLLINCCVTLLVQLPIYIHTHTHMHYHLTVNHCVMLKHNLYVKSITS